MTTNLKVNKRRTIEIIGPPGIGKSKLYEEICRTWHPTMNWIYYDILMAPEKPHILEFIKWLEYNYRWYTGKKLSKSISTNLGLEFINTNKELAEFCWRYLTQTSPHNSIDNRFRHAFFLYNDSCRYQAIAEKNNPKPCLIDEGLLQKSFLIHDSKQLMDEILNEYLSVVPLPYAVIGLNTGDIDLIINQIRNRKKVLPFHQDKDRDALINNIENWQYFIQSVLDKVQEKNVLVYRIDGRKSLTEKVSVLSSILGSMPL